MARLKALYHKHRKAAWLGAAALIAAGGYGLWRWYKAKNAAPPAFESVAKGDLEVRFKESGEVSPKNYVDVASKVSGRVIEMRVPEGKSVKKGDPLAVIQPGRTEAERYVPSTILSPLSGTVMRYVNPSNQNEGSRFSRVGDYVTGLFESQTPTYLMTVADLGSLIVKMQISEMDILKLSPGLPVEVAVDAIPEKKLKGRVSLISPQAEKNQSGLKVFKVEVELDAAAPGLKPGMTARVDALLQKRAGVLKVPLAAVFEEGGKTHVYLEEAKKKPRRMEVALGLRGEMEAEILSAGLSEKDKLHTEKPGGDGL